jgi:hypothetical protein
MSALTPPAMDAPGAEWGAFAVSIPGFPWMPGMAASIGQAASRVDDIAHPWPDDVPSWPDPDDPATAGCLLALLARTCWIHRAAVLPLGAVVTIETPDGLSVTGRGSTLGRACIAAAAALGRWPGGTE